MKLYDKDLNLVNGDISGIIQVNTVEISKQINGIYKISFIINNLSSIFNTIKAKMILEVEGDYYVIENIRKVRTEASYNKEISAYHIFSETKNIYWENDFEVINATPWATDLRITIGLFYTYDGGLYQATESHVAGETFEASKFNNVSLYENNYMPDTTPYNVLQRLFNGTDWTVQAGDTFTSTDFLIERGSIYNNILNILEVWGGELKLNKRTISLKKSIGTDKTTEFKIKKNIISEAIDEDYSNIVNKLYIYGNSGLTIEAIEDEKFLVDLDSIEEYGELVSEVVFTSILNVEYLRERGQEELNRLSKPKKSIDTSILDLDNLDGSKFDLGDRVFQIDNELGENEQYRIVSISYNPYKKKIFSLNLGANITDIKNIFKQIIENQNKNNDILRDEMENIPNNALFVSKLLDVVKFETISVENAHILNAWISNLYVDRVETNNWLKDIRNPDIVPVNGEIERNYIVIQDQYINFITETLDATQNEDLIIPNPDRAKNDYINVYYTSIDPADVNAYRYYTTTHPQIYHPDITEANAELFKVKIYKTKTDLNDNPMRYIKMQLKFNENGDNNPELTFGVGSGLTELSDKVKFFKGGSYFNMIYYNSEDMINGLQINQNNTVVRNSYPDNVGTGAHLRNIIVGDQEPEDLSPSIGYIGDIYIQI